MPTNLREKTNARISALLKRHFPLCLDTSGIGIPFASQLLEIAIDRTAQSMSVATSVRPFACVASTDVVASGPGIATWPLGRNSPDHSHFRQRPLVSNVWRPAGESASLVPTVPGGGTWARLRYYSRFGE